MAQNILIDISESEVREALIDYINQHSCMRLRPLEKLIIGSIDVRNAFQYTLESFSENRETKPKYVPFKGQIIDGPSNGPIPNKWDVIVSTPQSFTEPMEIKVFVPHSDEVKICHICHGRGKVTCSLCGGSGNTTVTTYNSKTEKHESHSETCSSCSGSGRVKCRSCSGSGRIVWYLQLKIIWETFRNSCFINEIPSSVFPNKLIEKAEGEIVFSQEGQKVSPVHDFPNVAVMEASIGFNEKHQNSYESRCQRILEQRHQIKSILIAMIDYKYKKKKEGKFYVYDNARHVYFPKYPGNNLRFCTLS